MIAFTFTLIVPCPQGEPGMENTRKSTGDSNDETFIIQMSPSKRSAPAETEQVMHSAAMNMY